MQISVTNAGASSPLPYFKGKGLVEEAIGRSGLSYAIIRPTLIFGQEGLLLDNITWFLQRHYSFLNFNSMPKKPGMPAFTNTSSSCIPRQGGENSANLLLFRYSATPPSGLILATYLER